MLRFFLVFISFLFTIVLLLLLLLYLKPGKDFFVNTFKHEFGMDVPSAFEVVDTEWGVSPGDMHTSIQVKYNSKEEFDSFLESFHSDSLKLVGRCYQKYLDDNENFYVCIDSSNAIVELGYVEL